MPYISDREYAEYKNRRYACPKCYAKNNFKIIEFPDYRYSRCASYTVKCLSCGHVYEVADMETG